MMIGLFLNYALALQVAPSLPPENMVGLWQVTETELDEAVKKLSDDAPEQPGPTEIKEQPKPVPAPKPEPPVTPVSTPKKAAPSLTTTMEPPVVRVKAPAKVKMGHIARVDFQFSGGPVRDFDTEYHVTGQLANGTTVNWSNVDPKKEPKVEPQFEPGDIELSADGKHLLFGAEAGIFTVSAFCVGKEKGHSTHSIKIIVAAPAPPVVVKPANALPTPAELIKKAAQGVIIADKQQRKEQTIVVVKAGRLVVDKLKIGTIAATPPEKVVEEWALATFQLMTAEGPFGLWNKAPMGDSFFMTAERLFKTASDMPKYNPATLLETLCNALETETF